MGVQVEPKDLRTAPLAARSYMLSNGLRPFALIEDELKNDFVGVDDQDPNAVLVGLAPDKFDYKHVRAACGAHRMPAPSPA